eukprot:523794_1
MQSCSIERKIIGNNDDNFDVDDAHIHHDGRSNDAQLSKPCIHNYSTLTMESGNIVIANQLKKDISINNKKGCQYAYHNITVSGFGKLQNVITVAKKHSDVDTLIH